MQKATGLARCGSAANKSTFNSAGTRNDLMAFNPSSDAAATGGLYCWAREWGRAGLITIVGKYRRLNRQHDRNDSYAGKNSICSDSFHHMSILIFRGR